MNNIKTAKQQAAYVRARKMRDLDRELLEELSFYTTEVGSPLYARQVDFSERAPVPSAEGWQDLGV